MIHLRPTAYDLRQIRLSLSSFTKKCLIAVLAVSCLSLVLGFNTALAQTLFTLTNPLDYDDLIELIEAILDGLIQISIPLAAILVLWAGSLYMFGGGDATRVGKATKALLYTAIGFGIVLISRGVISIVEDLLGLGPTSTCDVICTVADLIAFFNNVSGWLFAFAIIAGVAMIIIGGIAYMFAKGDPERASRAGKMILYTTIGVAIVALTWSIVNIIAYYLTGTNVFKTTVNYLTDTKVFSKLFFNEAYAISAITPPSIAPTQGPQTLTQLFQLAQNMLGWLFVFAVLFGIGGILIGGIMYITAAGDPKRAETGTKMILYTIIGILFVAVSWGLVNVIGNYFVGKRILG